MHVSPNKPAAGNAGFASQLAVGHPWPGVPEPERSARRRSASPKLVQKTILALSVALAAATASAQGLVNFANTPTTLVSVVNTITGTSPPISGGIGSYYFGLCSGTPSNNPVFTGLYATNTGVDGMFNGGTAQVQSAPVGTVQTFFVVGWSANLGETFQRGWLLGNFNGVYGFFGESASTTGVVGDGISIPPLNIFGSGGNSITTGFLLGQDFLIPEPSSAALAILGATMVVIFRRRRKLKAGTLMQP